MTDPLRPPDTDEEPWFWQTASTAYVQRHTSELDEFFDDLERPDRRPVIYTVALLAGLTLAAIAWRVLR